MKPLVLLAVLAGTIVASPIMVGPIGLNGFGTLTAPDYAAYGAEGVGGMGLVLHASGSNGTDTVSIDTWDVELCCGGFGGPPKNLVLSMPTASGCTVDYYFLEDICQVTIDGITGYSAFSQIGGTVGLLQVYSGPYASGTLLAQAEITNTLVEVTDVTFIQGNLGKWTANFLVVDPPSDVPEPSSLTLLGGGLLICIVVKSAPFRSWPLSARILKRFARSVEAPGGTERHVGEHALDFVLDTVPGFLTMIKGKSVLDYGCGLGDQAIAMKRAGASRVVGFDAFPKFPADHQGVEFTSELPTERFDVVLSCSALEHFADPEGECFRMRELTSPSGKLIITWAEPWFSNNGSHMGNFIHLPWVNLFFPERSVFLVRSLYRDDGATTYATAGLGGALNRMTVGRFERIIKESGMRVEYLHHTATRKLPLVTHIPVLRELLTSACTVILSN